MALAVAQRRDPLRVRDDRTRRGLLGCEKHPHASRPRRGRWVINGEKYYISGAGDPRCKVMICMVQTSPDGPPHQRQSQILVPTDTPRCGDPRADARLRRAQGTARPHAPPLPRRARPKANVLWGIGRGFEISQVRLGPGRIHHCMRSIGAAERALDLMVRRGLNRRRWCPSGFARSSTRRSRSMARPVSRSGRRGPGCTPDRAPCASPTGPTRSTWHVVGRAELTRYEDDHESTVGPSGERSGTFAGP